MGSAITALFSGENFEEAKQTLIQLCQAFNFDTQAIESYAITVQELVQSFSTTATAEQNLIFLEKLEAFKTSYTAILTSIDGLENFFTDPTFANDPLNQELFQIFTNFESDISGLDASTAAAFFTSQEIAINSARALVLAIQASERAVANNTGENVLAIKNFTNQVKIQTET